MTLKSVAKQLSKYLPDTGIEHDTLVWVPLGYGMKWFDGGLKVRTPKGLVRLRDLTGQQIQQATENLPTFVQLVKSQTGVCLDDGGNSESHSESLCLRLYRWLSPRHRRISKAESARQILEMRRTNILSQLQDAEATEGRLMTEGRTASTQARKRIASEVSRCRKNIARLNSLLAVVDGQLNICASTLFSNQIVELKIDLPSDEELVKDGETALEICESVASHSATADLVSQHIEHDGVNEVDLTSILAEFDVPANETTLAESEPVKSSESAIPLPRRAVLQMQQEETC